MEARGRGRDGIWLRVRRRSATGASCRTFSSQGRFRSLDLRYNGVRNGELAHAG